MYDSTSGSKITLLDNGKPGAGVTNAKKAFT